VEWLKVKALSSNPSTAKKKKKNSYTLLLLFLVGLGFKFGALSWQKSGIHKAGALPLKSLLQSIFALGIVDMGISQTICPSWPQTKIFPISASQVAWISWITGMSHQLLA
jgi:hypothetical protein